MFKKGDYVIYGTNGICEIIDITTLDLDQVLNDKMYYILRPIKTKDGRIFAPMDNNKTVIRNILSKEEATTLINEIPNIKGLLITNEKLRESTYKESMKSCDCREWIRVIKTLYLRNQERMAQGKKSTSVDERYLKLAKDSLYSELSFPLDIPKEEMERYIDEKMNHFIQ